jgi:predicted AAA+ superfamily ATPase
MAIKEIFKEILRENNENSLESNLITRKLDLVWLPKKATVLKGVRRSGKSTLAEMAVKRASHGLPILKINFADDRLNGLNINDLQDSLNAFYDIYPEIESSKKECWMIFDEIQLIKGWELFIERLLRDPKNLITVTGSSAKLLSQEIATEMRGRSLSFEVYPLSFQEYLLGHHAKPSKRYLDDYLLTGGFPELLYAPKNVHKRILQEYFESICYRDIVERYEIKNPIAVKDLALILAGQHSQLITINKLFERLKSTGHKIQKNFVTDILTALQDSYSFFKIPLWSDSRSKQNVNPKKSYCIDSGLVTAIRTGISQNQGRLLEGVIFCELLRREYKVYYFKTELGLEIDFVVQDPNDQLYLIQVCSELSSENLEREIRPFLEIRPNKHFKNAKCILICGSKIDARLNIPSFIKSIPAYEFLLEIT